jgi:hypothetical protein
MFQIRVGRVYYRVGISFGYVSSHELNDFGIVML